MVRPAASANCVSRDGLDGGVRGRVVRPDPADENDPGVLMEDLFGAFDSRPITMVVEGEPQGKGRPRAASRGGFVSMYTPKKTKDYEQLIATEARASMQGRALIEGPVSVEMEMYHAIRKSWTKKKREMARIGKVVPTIKIDVDNCLKVFCDALNGVVWKDDVQVVNVTISKRFSDEPCVLFRVIPMNLQSA
jgi:Holliday junction resolvase RusA-like endonuclease